MKEKIVAGLAALTIAGTAEAEFAKVEGFVNNDKTLIEVKAGANVGEETNVGFYVRDRISLDYDGTTGNFLLTQISLGQEGVPVRVHTNLNMPGIDPKLEVGTQYLLQTDEGRFFASLSGRASLPLHGELLLSANYSLDLGKGDLVFEAESINWTDKVQDGVDFSGTVRAHLGYKPRKDVMFGIAAEVDYKHQQGQGSQHAARGGVFIRLGN
jgi:hypothetical protein